MKYLKSIGIFDVLYFLYFIILSRKSKLLFMSFIYNLDMSLSPQSKTIFADNKKALFDYEIIEEYEAGIKLYGEEVKSVRTSNINLK